MRTSFFVIAALVGAMSAKILSTPESDGLVLKKGPKNGDGSDGEADLLGSPDENPKY